MGCFFAARLLRAGADVTLLAKNDRRAGLLNKKGIYVKDMAEGKLSWKKYRVFAEGKVKPAKHYDLIFLCVKAYDTEKAVKRIVPVLSEDTLLLSLQNGWGNLEAIQRYVEPRRVVAGATNQGVTCLEYGRAVHTGAGETVVGSPGKNGKITRACLKVAAVLNESRIPASCTTRIHDVLWGKLLVNACINSLGVLLRVPNGKLPAEPWSRMILEETALEAERIARKKGYVLPYKNPVKKVTDVCKKTSKNFNSMLQDVLRGKKTEIDYINGAVVREGKKLGIPAPANEMLFYLVKSLQS